MTDLDKIAALAAHEALPRARVIVPWWTRLLLWFLEPPPVRARALPQPADDVSPRDVPGSAPVEVTPSKRRASLVEIVIEVRRLRGEPIDHAAVLEVAKRMRVAGATLDEVAIAVERARTAWPP